MYSFIHYYVCIHVLSVLSMSDVYYTLKNWQYITQLPPTLFIEAEEVECSQESNPNIDMQNKKL